MGDAGEGLIDAESRIQERMEEIVVRRRQRDERDPVQLRAVESLRLARTDLERQLSGTSHERRRQHIAQAIAEVDRQIAEGDRAIAEASLLLAASLQA